jgi:hypothetical protein
MRLAWGSFSHKTQGWLKAGGLVAAGLAALTFGVVMPRDAHQGIAGRSALAWQRSLARKATRPHCKNAKSTV